MGSTVWTDLDQARLTVRASGVEPKAKFCLGAQHNAGTPTDRIRAANAGSAMPGPTRPPPPSAPCA
ncbi:hypothetical protein SPAR_31086 [Streptomyces sparsogenes DSM 40356]|uniref:Uncharacterized protein n=1 Tax=Streptomyces sparsogenes DSM 40356 TaxID=1331668 RepID=A0A1R1SBT2_9ACTN|nr:hypothetical protein SPAR_31086 [Streptomyces sparsogenes DSM 40356]